VLPILQAADPAPDEGRLEKDLVEHAKAGSLEAFEELVYGYEGRIYAFLFNCCRSDADARDLTQETFVRAFRALSRFDIRHSFGPWLFTIARRKWLDRARVRKPSSFDDLPAEIADTDDPAELLSREEQRQNLWCRARLVLPDAQFHSLWLRYVEGMDVAEIATVLSKTQTHIKVLLFRARRTLAADLRSADQTYSDLERPPLQAKVCLHRVGTGSTASVTSSDKMGRGGTRPYRIQGFDARLTTI
jgi:RNA polymerase sigma-70 factor (ECF subfamily)